MFDEPSSTAGDEPAPAPGYPASGAPATGDWLARLRATPVAIGLGLIVAAVGLTLAVVLATGAVAGDVTVDPGSGRPIGPTGTAGIEGGGAGALVVDVAGAVLRPGVYRLPPGARVGDAIAAAGGYSPRVAADVTGRALNLAAQVHDGDLIVVPSRDDPPASSAPGSGPGGSGGSGGGHLVDLNHASADELDALPGIGPVTAAKIIAARADAPFASVEQLLERKLVSQSTFDKVKALVTAG